jgi:hypothetical protein
LNSNLKCNILTLKFFPLFKPFFSFSLQCIPIWYISISIFLSLAWKFWSHKKLKLNCSLLFGEIYSMFDLLLKVILSKKINYLVLKLCHVWCPKKWIWFFKKKILKRKSLSSHHIMRKEKKEKKEISPSFSQPLNTPKK